jgi:hypothetical protein
MADRVYTRRGLLIRDLLDCHNSQQVIDRIGDVKLDPFQAFTLAVLSVNQPAVVIDWNGQQSAIDLKGEAKMPLISSSLQDPNVIDLRRKLFSDMVVQQGKRDADLLYKFHRSHLPERGPISVCMHRQDAATVSLSAITVSAEKVEFSYHSNCPCRSAPPRKVLLERGDFYSATS